MTPDNPRPPPASVAAEQAILGLLLRGEAAWPSELVKPGDFADAAHTTIAVAMQTLGDMGKPCDLPSVAMALEVGERLGDIGGMEYLNGLAAGAGTVANFVGYAGQIRTAAARRRAADALARGDLGAARDHIEVAADVTSKAQRLTFSTVEDLILTPPPAWRVVGAVPDAGIGVVWGGPGSGKTFALLDLCLAVVRGIRYHGRRVKQCGIAYVATEGALRNRIAAYLSHNNLSPSALSGFRVLHSSVDLLRQGADLKALIASLREVEGQIGSLGVVVIDTLNRAMAGGNENAAEDMGAMVAAAQRIANELGCLVIYVHHCGKDESKGGRGHSSLKGAIDFELAVKRDFDTDIRTLLVEKLRDGRDGETLLSFRLTSVDLGAVSDFDPDADAWERLTSCVVEPCQAELSATKGKAHGAVQRAVVTLLADGPLLKADLVAKLAAVGHGRSSAYAALKSLMVAKDIAVGFDKRYRVTPIRADEECPNVQNSQNLYKTGQDESGCTCPFQSSVSIDTGWNGQTGHPGTPKPDPDETTEPEEVF